MSRATGDLPEKMNYQQLATVFRSLGPHQLLAVADYIRTGWESTVFMATANEIAKEFESLAENGGLDGSLGCGKCQGTGVEP
jgi:hypothetical protein